MISSRDVDDLLPHVADLARVFVAHAKDAGIDLIVYSTYRDAEAQDALYDQGRTAPGRIVTNARGGESFHNYGLAFDVVPIVGGKLVWSASDPVWRHIIKIGTDLGLESGANWNTLKDVDHFQWRGGLTLAQLQAGERPTEVA